MKKTIALLALLAAFPPLSTDMYLAAIPLLVDGWRAPLAVVNFTLVGFFLTYCLFLLIYGPLSDRLGRRPPLLTGLLLYLVASLLCATAGGIEQMIFARVLQGAGAASASSIAFAICKDRFDGNLRQRIFLQLGVIVAAAPMIAPMIGGWVIETFSWRWIFVLQAGLGLVAAVGVWRMEEPLRQRSSEKMHRVFAGYLRLAANLRYFLLTLAFSVVGIPFFAFIAVSSDVYIRILGYTEREYGYFFGLNSMAFMLAPLLFGRAVRRFRLSRLLSVSYLGVFAASLLMLVPGIPQPYRLAVPMWFLTFFFAFGRPPGNNLILEQVEQDVGAASSLMVFVFFLIGSCSMWFISLGWRDVVEMLGLLGTGSAVVTMLAWLAINSRLRLRFPGDTRQ